MERVGALLKRERERQQKTLRELAEATKISITALQAIEGDRVEFLPPPSYTRGFIRIYARELGLDPAEVLQLYEQGMLNRRRWGAQQELTVHETRRFGGLIAAGATIVCAAAVLVWFMSLERTPPMQQNVVREESVPAPAAPAPAAATSETAAAKSEPDTLPQPAAPEQPPAEEQTPFSVRFESRERTWMRLHADNQSALDVLLKPGETHTQTARYSLRVRIGNPAGVSVFHNERPVSLPGDLGKPLELRFP